MSLLKNRLVLGGLLALLTLAATLLLVSALQLRDEEAAANQALTDPETTSQVIGDVSTTLSKVFSYAPGQLKTVAADADTHLAGRAAAQYEELFGQVKEQVAAQRLTLTTHVVRAGVTSLDGREARLLVFLDQVSARKGGKESAVAAQLSVTAELRGGQWRVVDMKSR